MQEADVPVRRRKKYKVTTNSNHKQPVFDNLVKRQFDVPQQDRVYVSDVTYVWTQEGWLYLAVVIDLCSRKVVGWSMSSRMKAQLVCDALYMAIWRRRPEAGLIHHSDRGSQYASKAFRRLLKAHGIKGSMSRKGDCWDNAVVESFFGSLKQERVQWRNYQARYEPKGWKFWIERPGSDQSYEHPPRIRMIETDFRLRKPGNWNELFLLF